MSFTGQTFLFEGKKYFLNMQKKSAPRLLAHHGRSGADRDWNEAQFQRFT